MSKPNLKLAEAPPPRTPEREALAQAMADHEAAQQSLRKVQDAAEEADQLAWRANDALEAAQKALSKAKQTEGERLAAVALQEPTDLLSAAAAQSAVNQATVACGCSPHWRCFCSRAAAAPLGEHPEEVRNPPGSLI